MLPPDQETLLLLREHPELAYKRLFDKYWEPLFRVALGKMPSAEEARDIVQDIFVTLWEKRDSIEHRETLFPWLLVTLKNRIFNYYAKNESRLRYTIEQQHSFNAVINDVAESSGAKELKQIIETTIAALPPRTQQVFRLSREEGRSPKEIAALLELSVQTVKNLLHKAGQQVRASVAQKIDLVTLLTLVGTWLEK